MNNLTETEKVAFAWLWDAEGSITCNHVKHGVYSVLSLGMVNSEFVMDKHKRLGIGTIRQGSRRKDKDWRDLVLLNMNRVKDVRDFLTAVMPYLQIKKKQAEIAMEMCNTHSYNKKIKLAEELHKLNEKGKAAAERRSEHVVQIGKKTITLTFENWE